MPTSLKMSKIRSGLDEVRNLGKIEDTFRIEGHLITIQTLDRPQEETVQSKARAWLEGDNPEMLGYVNTQKYETLAHAIVRIDDLDFRGVDYVEVDGEDDQKRVEPHDIIADILQTWDINLIEVVWDKYRDLNFKSKQDLREQVDFVDREAELESMRARVEELEEELGLNQDEGESEDEGSSESVDGEMTEEAVRDAVFASVDDDQAEEIERAVMESSGGGDQPPQEQPPQEQPPQRAANAEVEPRQGGGDEKPEEGPDMRHYDPETGESRELTDDEREAYMEMERIRERRQGRSKEENEEREEAEQLSNKRRKMNRTAPQVSRGSLPDKGEAPKTPSLASSSDEDRPGDYVESEPEHLGGSNIEDR